MDERELLKEALDKLVRLARINKNTLTESKLSETLFELKLDDSQLELIKQFLETKKVRVISEAEEEAIAEARNKEDDIDLDSEDVTAIDFYYEELKGLPVYSDAEKIAVAERAIEGDEEAQKTVVTMYLPQVVEIAKLYSGQGIPVEDLIGEGNMGLFMGCHLLGCLDSVEELDGHIGSVIMDAMDALVSSEQDDEKLIKKMAEDLKKNKAGTSENEMSLPLQERDIFGGDELLREAFELLAEEDEKEESGKGEEEE